MVEWLYVLLICLVGGGLTVTLSAYFANYFGAMWVPSSFKTVQIMLDLAEVKPGQYVVDLGAGDGRIVMMAARHFQAKAVGVEIDPLRVLFANSLIILLGLRSHAWVYYGNLFSFDVTQADVVFIYLKKAANKKLRPRLTEQLRPGVKVVSRFAIPGWTAQFIDDSRLIFLYEIGNTGPDVETRLV